MDTAKIQSPVIWPYSLLLISALLCEVFLKAVPGKYDNIPNSKALIWPSLNLELIHASLDSELTWGPPVAEPLVCRRNSILSNRLE